MLNWLKIASGSCIAAILIVSQIGLLSDPGRLSAQASAAQDPEHYTPRQVLQRPIRPIINPVIVAAQDTDTAQNELVIGVAVNGAARAYPINQLTGPNREIINDVLGGTAIAATW